MKVIKNCKKQNDELKTKKDTFSSKNLIYLKVSKEIRLKIC